jgi:phage major head subunit gpT-like protein
MRAYTGEDGEPLGVDPRLLIVPPQLEKEALEIVAAERNSSGATNVLRGTAEVLVVPELANEGTVWYLADVSKGIMPLVFQMRQEPVITAMDQPTDEGVFSENQMRVGVKARGAAGYGLWWLIARAAA